MEGVNVLTQVKYKTVSLYLKNVGIKSLKCQIYHSNATL
jgi:hypothetical protein